jgi:hypothetical protein
MFILALKQTHFRKIFIITDGKAHVRPKYHAAAPHKVVHHVLKSWFKFVVVDSIEIYFVLCDNVHSDVTFYEIDHAFVSKFGVIDPGSFVFSFIVFTFVKAYLVRALGNESLFLDEIELIQAIAQ